MKQWQAKAHRLPKRQGKAVEIACVFYNKKGEAKTFKYFNY